MATSTFRQIPRTLTRALLLLTASCAAVGVGIEVFYYSAHPSWVPPDAGYSTSFPAGWQSGLNRFAFFTAQSNTLTTFVCTYLALAPTHHRLWRNLHLVALVDMTLTSGVYLVVLLGPNLGSYFPTEIIAASTLEHVVTPLLLWGSYLSFSPLTLRWHHLGITALHPALYAAFTLTRGHLVDWYPYVFMDVPRLGLGPVIASLAVMALVIPTACFFAHLLPYLQYRCGNHADTRELILARDYGPAHS